MEQIYRRASHIHWDDQETESLILTFGDKNQFIELNRSAALIWKWTNGSNSIGVISKKLSLHYNISLQEAYQDVSEIFEMWYEDELVKLHTNKTFI
jgi:hypothetical protein